MEYYFSDVIEVNWYEAQRLCTARGGTLGTILSKEEDDFIRSQLIKWYDECSFSVLATSESELFQRSKLLTKFLYFDFLGSHLPSVISNFGWMVSKRT